MAAATKVGETFVRYPTLIASVPHYLSSAIKVSEFGNEHLYFDPVSVPAPDGSSVQVSKPCSYHVVEAYSYVDRAGDRVERESSSWEWDRRDRVVLDNGEKLSTLPEFDDRSYRVVEGVDYASHGMVKIGNTWVNRSNAKAIANAETVKEIHATVLDTCVIL